MKIPIILLCLICISLQVQIYMVFSRTNKDRERIERLELKKKDYKDIQALRDKIERMESEFVFCDADEVKVVVDGEEQLMQMVYAIPKKQVESEE